MTKLSVILPVYNGERYISQAIESVLNQTFGDFELIIIDDGSDDDTSKILAQFKQGDQRIKIIRNIRNLGVVKSLNIGLRSAAGDFIARIDADDIWKSDKLERQIKHFENDAELYLSATAKINIDENGVERMDDLYPQIFDYHEIRKSILKRNIICHSSVVFKRKILEEVGYYNESYINSEDYEYWIRIAASHKIEILEDPLVCYRISKETVSYNRIKEQRRYAIKAKISGVKILQHPMTSYFFILRDIPYLLIPEMIYRLRKKYRQL